MEYTKFFFWLDGIHKIFLLVGWNTLFLGGTVGQPIKRNHPNKRAISEPLNMGVQSTLWMYIYWG